MELRHLRYFQAVAETCHFGRAAERLLIAQPALSQAIRNLEAELGTPLFTRTTRQVALTPAGEFLLEKTRHIFAAVEDAVRGVEEMAAGRTGVIRLGLVGGAAFSTLPSIVSVLRQHLPQITLDVRADMLTPDLCEAIRAGRIDVAILRPPVIGDGIRMEVVQEEPLILAVPSSHPLALARQVALEDLRTAPYIGYGPQDSAVDRAAMRAFRAVDVAPVRVHVASGTAELLAMVAAGMGVSLVPASARALPLAGVVFRRVEGAGTVELALGWGADDPNPLVASVVQVLAGPAPELAQIYHALRRDA